MNIQHVFSYASADAIKINILWFGFFCVNDAVITIDHCTIQLAQTT